MDSVEVFQLEQEEGGTMKRSTRPLTLAALALLGAACPALAGSWSIGVRFGVPAYFGPCGGYYCHRPYPVYVRPTPVIVERPVAVVQPVLPPAYQPPPPPPAQAPPPAITPAALDDRQGDVQRLLQRLSERDERV